MPRFMFAYHGGKRPDDDAEGMQEIQRWKDWLDGMGDVAYDRGNPVGFSKTVYADRVEDNGGSNPLSGYSIVNVTDIDAAVAIAKQCPILPGGTIEVVEIMEM
ncbi:MAG: YciI family protein [Pseudomonadota bacterium]